MMRAQRLVLATLGVRQGGGPKKLLKEKLVDEEYASWRGLGCWVY